MKTRPGVLCSETNSEGVLQKCAWHAASTDEYSDHRTLSE